MSGVWFRRRASGGGFAVVSWQGMVAVLVFVAVITASVIAPGYFGLDQIPAALIGALLFLIELAIFLGVVRRHTDRS